jgi:hypothetical protein
MACLNHPLEIEMEIAGKKVVDAKKPAKILITKRDVVVGDNKNPSSCAAAIAAKRDVPECLSARVHIGRVYIEHKDKWVRYLTPDALRTEIVAFDRGGSFQPGEYVLKAPSPTETAEGRHKAYADKAYPNGRSEAQRIKDRAAAARSGSNSNPRTRIKIARIKRHKVTGIRPKGAVR